MPGPAHAAYRRVVNTRKAAARSDGLKAWVQDVGLTLVLVLFGFGGTHPASQDQLEWSREPNALAYVFVVLAALPFVVRRRYPGPVLAASGAAVLAYLAAGYAFGPIMMTIPVAAYTVGSLLPLRRAVQWVGSYYFVTFVVIVARMIDDSGESLWRQLVGWAIASLAAFAAPLAIGAAMRVRRESDTEVRAAQARRAVSEERLRMAQELHDSVGHGLAVIAMQAGVALHVLERNPDKVREALEAIRDTSRESLDGLRTELQVLRTPDGELAPRRPTLGLAELDVLLDRIRAGGVAIDARIDSEVADLPPDVDVATYRILQESLTNVLRHAGATRTGVRVRRHDREVLVEVTDNGQAGADVAAGGPGDRRAGDGASTGGSGIPGMRARAEALGGSLEAGPRPEGGFAVRARLPVGEPAVPGSAP